MPENNEISDALKYITAGAAFALGAGTLKAFNLGDIGGKNLRDGLDKYLQKPLGKGLNSTSNLIKKTLKEETDILDASLLTNASEIKAILEETDRISEVRASLQADYKAQGRIDELTVGELLDSLIKGKRSPAQSNQDTYATTIGLRVKTVEAEMLQRLTQGPDAVISRDMILDKNLFLDRNKGSVYKSFGLESLKDMALSMEIPFLGNPLDIILGAKTPSMSRVSEAGMKGMGHGGSEGVFIGGQLYRKFANKKTQHIGKARLAREGSSLARSFQFTNPALRTHRDILSSNEKGPGLAEAGYYDRSSLQALAEPILESKFFKSMFGDQSFVYKPAGDIGNEILPLTAKLDLAASKVPFLNSFSARYSRDKTIYSEHVQSAINRTGSSTTLKPVDPSAAERAPSLVERFKNIFGLQEGHKGGFSSLTDDEVELFYNAKSKKIDTAKLRRYRNDISSLRRPANSELTPNAVNRELNLIGGDDINKSGAARYIPMPDNLGQSATNLAMQSMNTTISLMEKFTGIGLKHMGPAQVIGTAIAGSSALYLASDVLGLLDFAIEKANPFGDVGVKKTALYSYAALRTAQQYMLNFLSPLFTPNEELAPGSTDSLLGSFGRGIVGAVIGRKLGRHMARQGGAGYLTPTSGAILGGLALGSQEVNKSGGDRWDEFMGDKLVDIRESRFWMLSPNDFRGGDVKYQRKSLIASELSDEKFDVYGGKAGYYLNASMLSLPTRMLGGVTGIGDATGIQGLDPYAVEKMNYHNQPYPVTGNMFEDVPIVGDILGETIGQVFKPTKLMHVREINAYYHNQRMNSNDMIGIANQLGIDTINPPIEIPRTKNLMDAIGASTDKLMDFFGLRGFLISSAKGVISGDNTFTPEDLTFKDAGDMTNVARAYNEMELGGLLGASELIRRILTGNRGSDTFNPMDPEFRNNFSRFNKVQVHTGNPYDQTAFSPGSGITSDPMYAWNKRDTINTLPFVGSKLYGEMTPLQLYKERVMAGSDFYDWNDPLNTIAAPYIQNTYGAGALAGALKGGIFAAFGRTPVAATILGGLGGAGGLAIGSMDPNISDREQSRRDTEQLYSSLKHEKIEKLKVLAQRQGRKDVMSQLYKLQTKTLGGLNYSLKGGSFLKQAYAALPNKDRRYLMDFANAPVKERAAILEAVPEYMGEILQHAWSGKSMQSGDAKAKTLEVQGRGMRKGSMPDDNWMGWNPGVSLDKVKLTSVQQAGKNYHDYGFWGSDARDFERNSAYLEKAAIMPNMGGHGEEMSIMNSYGMSDFRLEVGPDTVNRSDIFSEHTNDRSNYVMNQLTSSGRF